MDNLEQWYLAIPALFVVSEIVLYLLSVYTLILSLTPIIGLESLVTLIWKYLPLSYVVVNLVREISTLVTLLILTFNLAECALKVLVETVVTVTE